MKIELNQQEADALFNTFNSCISLIGLKNIEITENCTYFAKKVQAAAILDKKEKENAVNDKKPTKTKKNS